MGRYTVLSTLAHGMHGVVLKARDEEDGRLVALKQARYEEGEVPRAVLREVKILKEIRHAHVVEMLDVHVEGTQVVIAYEYMHVGSLADVIGNTKVVLETAVMKGMVQMMLEGIKALHDRFVMHRDIKPGNVLITQEGVLKLADFGLAKPFGDVERRIDTPEVCTYPYRAPELFFGAYKYSPTVDCWSVGCVAAELFLRVPLFPCDSELSVLAAIAGLFPLDWPGADLLPRYVAFQPPREASATTALSRVLQTAPALFVSLLTQLLEPNPARRAAATAALLHPWFKEEPAPTLLKLPEQK
eukprot:TRINITY_DN19354_c0_g1_i1.p2 TRINITY_DN19354_c0_g1~~TRINITY_DN19354_c0_g1_i1.p2  ORF type:complete len:300 (+),score=107.60 TRINITY_DN19354_c0_g1_i1:96-995(+)